MEELSESEEGTQTLRCEDDVDGLSGEKVELRSVIGGEGNENSEQGLRSKLQDLQALRAEIDEDIMSLQRVLSIMGGTSP